MADDYDCASPTLENDGNNSKPLLGKDNFMKPEKVKSRWRRNSEMESCERPTIYMSPKLEVHQKDVITIKERESPPKSAASVNNSSISPNNDDSMSKNSLPVYDPLEENLYLFERKRTKRKKEIRRMLCDCSLTKEEKSKGILGCRDDCMNQLLMIECGSRCALEDACSNKRFQKKLYAKTMPFKTEKKGWGLNLLEDIPRGTFVIEYVGEIINLQDFKQRVKQYAREKKSHYYFMALKSDEIIDATNKGNLSRFMNHSCDPNCETQKWTVNGELRIGFFAKRDLKAGDELTFDYQFERYGQNAQNCFCESDNCSGFIGVTNEITVDIDLPKNGTKRKKSSEEKKRDVLEDLMLEEEIQKLCVNGGLRNKDETLMLARLMVRAEDSHSREKLLDVILGTTEVACLRLFLDYHGLSLIWSWMAYLTDINVKKKILKALSLLPVPNKTMLLDSKVLSVVEKWAENSFDTQYDKDKTKVKFCDTSDSETDVTTCVQTSEYFSSSHKRESNTIFSDFCDADTPNPNSLSATGKSNIASSPPELKESSVPTNKIKTSETCLRSDEESADLLDEENNNKQSLSCNSDLNIANLAQNLLGSWKDLKDEFRIPRREVPKEENIVDEKPQEIRVVCNMENEKYNSFQWKKRECHYPPRLPKEEKRSKFAARMQRQRNKVMRDKPGFSPHYNGTSNYYASPENQPYDSGNVNYSATYNKPNEHYEFAYNSRENVPYTQNSYFNNCSTPRNVLPSPGSQLTTCGVPPYAENAVTHPSVFTPNVFIPPPPLHTSRMPFLGLPPPPIQESPNITLSQNNMPPHMMGMPAHSLAVNSPAIVPTASASSAGDLLYTSGYVNSENDFLVDQKPAIYIQSTFATTSQQSEQTYLLIRENGEVPPKMAVKLPPNWKTANDADGNLYYYHVITRETQWEPPGLEETVNDLDNGTPTYDEPKEHKHTTHSRRSHKKHSKRKSTTTAPADTSSNQVNGEIAKKIKELFRTKMSSFVVQCLNPYHKDDCRVGRITSNEDFKHLARKLTHFVMAKELKHCKNVEDLDCNENVKHKARDYIHKYMARYGPLYRKEKCVSFVDE